MEVYNACQLADKYDLSMTLLTSVSVCLSVRLSIYLPIHLSVM